MSYWFPAKDYKIVMVGLDNAGKTTALYRLNLGQAVSTVPTIGSNVERVSHNNMTFEVWDLGGQASLRSTWSLYLPGADAVIMVVDSTDRARMGIVKQELASLLSSNQLTTAPLLVLANKQDLKDAMSVLEMTEALGLPAMTTHDWQLQPCCAVNGEGLLEGLGWISQRIHRHLRSRK